MRSSVLLGVVPTAAALLAGTIPLPGGGYKLLGSSFGLLGQNATYDYVIIGGGTAGLTVANRLAQSCPGTTVAVVEAGSFYEIADNSNRSQVPAYDAFATTSLVTDLQPLVDWGQITTPQTQLGGRLLHYAAGKCFGGGSARNYMAYQRGTAGAYQRWADEVGDASYTFDQVLPFFRKSVNFSPPDYNKRQGGGAVLYNNSAYSSTGGPLHVSYANYWTPLGTFLQTSFKALGFPAINGFNDGQLEGFAEFANTIDPQTATRSSSQTSMLDDAIVHTDLQLYARTLVQRILFDSNKRANGVQVSTENTPYTLTARKEVILSAGVFRSPQLLMLSGIGPAATLKKFNIPMVSHLEGVGQNLWDQPLWNVMYAVNSTTQQRLQFDPAFAAQATQDFLQQQRGPLSLAGASVAGFEKLPRALGSSLPPSAKRLLASFPADWPDLEHLPLGVAMGPVPNPNENIMSMNVALQTTNSRGTVSISSTNANDNPLVNPNWLATPEDQAVAVQALRRSRELAHATGIVIGQELVPGPAVQTDAQILAYIKEAVGPIHHACATNKMGKQSDSRAVVDSHGRVFGVQNLRVIDASAFPFLPPGHCQSTVYMLAEKLAADIIANHS